MGGRLSILEVWRYFYRDQRGFIPSILYIAGKKAQSPLILMAFVFFTEIIWWELERRGEECFERVILSVLAFDVVKYLQTIYVNIIQYLWVVSCLKLARGESNGNNFPLIRSLQWKVVNKIGTYWIFRFLVANSNYSNSYSLSLSHSVTSCDIIFMWGN